MEIDKTKIAERTIDRLQPIIINALQQTSVENREDLKQELEEKIIKKIFNESIEELPGFFDISKQFSEYEVQIQE